MCDTVYLINVVDSARLMNFGISVGDTNNFSNFTREHLELCAYHCGMFGNAQNKKISCVNGPKRGRYVSVWMERGVPTDLMLCEVKVYGSVTNEGRSSLTLECQHETINI